MTATTTHGAEIQRRLRELQDGTHTSDLDRIERVSLRVLDQMGFESLQQVTGLWINIGDTEANRRRWEAWLHESIVWAARRLRAREYREALRGWGQIREYMGRLGGYVPGGSDSVNAIQNMLEKVIAEGSHA